MKLCILIHAHKNVCQLNRLINKLSNPNVVIYVNIDKKSDININQIDNKAKLIKRRINIQWGRFSQVEAILTSLKEIVSSESFDYLTLISGQDYPIKTIDDILHFFKSNPRKEYMQFASATNDNETLRRIQYYYFKNDFVTKCLMVFMRKLNLKRHFVENLIPYKGSSWWSLSYDCINYILTASNNKYINFFKTCFAPDEMFFHSIVLNSPYKTNVVNNDCVYIDWSEHLKNPKLLTSTDFNKLMESNDLFARKFDMSVDANILELIDKKILLNQASTIAITSAFVKS